VPVQHWTFQYNEN